MNFRRACFLFYKIKIADEGKRIKRTFILAVTMALVLAFSMQPHAALFSRGTDSLGNRLIYDSDLDITWYDYAKSWDTWQNQMDWAGALDVDFGGTHYTDWRLPETVDSLFVYGYDGTTTAGFNIKNSEMGHLFYTELGNKGYQATDGSYPQPGWGLTSTGDFQHWQQGYYWSGTEYAADTDLAWYFTPYSGFQDGAVKDYTLYALAVRPGDVPLVPEPVSMILFGIGGVVMAARRMMFGWRYG
jgi:hypothetical protein